MLPRAPRTREGAICSHHILQMPTRRCVYELQVAVGTSQQVISSRYLGIQSCEAISWLVHGTLSAENKERAEGPAHRPALPCCQNSSVEKGQLILGINLGAVATTRPTQQCLDGCSPMERKGAPAHSQDQGLSPINIEGHQRTCKTAADRCLLAISIMCMGRSFAHLRDVEGHQRRREANANATEDAAHDHGRQAAGSG